MKIRIEFIIVIVILFLGCKKSNHINRVTINGYSIGDTVKQGEFEFNRDLRDNVIFGTQITDTGFSIQTWNDTIVWMMKSYFSEDESKKLVSKIQTITHQEYKVSETENEYYKYVSYVWFDSLYLDQITLSMIIRKDGTIKGSLEIYNEWFVLSNIPQEPEIEMYAWEE